MKHQTARQILWIWLAITAGAAAAVAIAVAGTAGMSDAAPVLRSTPTLTLPF